MIDGTDRAVPGIDALSTSITAPARRPLSVHPDAVLAAALDAVVSLQGDDLEAVLAVAEASRPGVRAALRAACEAEAQRYAGLARQAFAAADRLADDPATGA